MDILKTQQKIRYRTLQDLKNDPIQQEIYRENALFVSEINLKHAKKGS